MWLDCRSLLSYFPPPHKYSNDPASFFREEAGVGLSDGRDFGSSGHLRLNFGELENRALTTDCAFIVPQAPSNPKSLPFDLQKIFM